MDDLLAPVPGPTKLAKQRKRREALPTGLSADEKRRLRRENNRQCAKNLRDRKMQYAEELQKRAEALDAANAELRAMVAALEGRNTQVQHMIQLLEASLRDDAAPAMAMAAMPTLPAPVLSPPATAAPEVAFAAFEVPAVVPALPVFELPSLDAAVLDAIQLDDFEAAMLTDPVLFGELAGDAGQLPQVQPHWGGGTAGLVQQQSSLTRSSGADLQPIEQLSPLLQSDALSQSQETEIFSSSPESSSSSPRAHDDHAGVVVQQALLQDRSDQQQQQQEQLAATHRQQRHDVEFQTQQQYQDEAQHIGATKPSVGLETVEPAEFKSQPSIRLQAIITTLLLMFLHQHVARVRAAANCGHWREKLAIGQERLGRCGPVSSSVLHAPGLVSMLPCKVS